MAFYKGDNSEAMIVGFLENKFADGSIGARSDRTISLPDKDGGVALIAESTFNTETAIRPNQEATAGRLAFQISPTPFEALEEYASALGKLNQVKIKKPINGWCHWAYTKHYVSEKEVRENAKFAADHLKDYGLKYIQIDDGYPKAYGDWGGCKI